MHPTTADQRLERECARLRAELAECRARANALRVAAFHVYCALDDQLPIELANELRAALGIVLREEAGQ